MQRVMSGAWESCYTPCWLGNGDVLSIRSEGFTPPLWCLGVNRYQAIWVRVNIQTLLDNERTRIVSYVASINSAYKQNIQAFCLPAHLPSTT